MLVVVVLGSPGGTQMYPDDPRLSGVLPRLAARLWKKFIKPTIKTTSFNLNTQQAR